MNVFNFTADPLFSHDLIDESRFQDFNEYGGAKSIVKVPGLQVADSRDHCPGRPVTHWLQGWAGWLGANRLGSSALGWAPTLAMDEQPNANDKDLIDQG
ncbi:hypothetical protein G7046_g8599 [Stylonectria norvegica]|nr:hypothetical protein G7046_g8599 [Stylonectria norvegica]